jgi:flagellar protein FliT
MATSNEVVHLYSELATTVTQMLHVGRTNEWSQLPQLDRRCAVIIERLRALKPHPQLEPDHRARLAALVAQIRSEQDELAALIRPQFTALIRNIAELQRQRKLAETYRAAPC